MYKCKYNRVTKAIKFVRAQQSGSGDNKTVPTGRHLPYWGLGSAFSYCVAARSPPRWLMTFMSAATAVATVMSVNARRIQCRLHVGRAVKGG